MSDRRPIQRRKIARELTRIINAPVRDVLSQIGATTSHASHRIGITGPAGGGKSTLISMLAKHRFQKVDVELIAVLAIDPSSPISGGSILGDRIRMDAIADQPGLFIRSVPSRGTKNGLCDNVVDLLATLDRHVFDEVILETVGIGQSQMEVRELVDTVVLLVPPDTGDSIQAMKAGIIEIADIFVVTKSENSSARLMATQIQSVLEVSRGAPDHWDPPVLMTRADGTGVAELSSAIDRHRDWSKMRLNEDETEARRRRYHLKALVARQVEEILAAESNIAKGDLQSSFTRLVNRLKK
jgi:LAO/AO transport system kinase